MGNPVLDQPVLMQQGTTEAFEHCSPCLILMPKLLNTAHLAWFWCQKLGDMERIRKTALVDALEQFYFSIYYIGKFMIPTDELHDFSEGSRRVGWNHQPELVDGWWL